MIKTFSKLRINGNILNLIMTTYKKSTANIILNDEKHKAFPLRSGPRQGCSLLTTPFNIILEVLANAVRQEEEVKGIQIEKEDIKLSLFSEDMIIYIEN